MGITPVPHLRMANGSLVNSGTSPTSLSWPFLQFYFSALDAYTVQLVPKAWTASVLSPKSDPSQKQGTEAVCDTALHGPTAQPEVLKHDVSCGRFAKDCSDSPLKSRKLTKRKKKEGALTGVEKPQKWAEPYVN